MKFLIKWHEDGLKNAVDTYDQAVISLHLQQEKVNQLRSRNTITKMQINEAKRQGRDAFDPDKFMKKAMKELDKVLKDEYTLELAHQQIKGLRVLNIVKNKRLTIPQ